MHLGVDQVQRGAGATRQVEGVGKRLTRTRRKIVSDQDILDVQHGRSGQKTDYSAWGVGAEELSGVAGQTVPSAAMARATFRKLAMLAPFT